MASNVGALGVVGLAKETTFGTGVAPTRFVPFSSEGFKDGPEAIQEAQMRGVLDQAPKYKGMQAVSGSLSGVAYPSILGDLLRAAMGAPTTTGTTPAYKHTFKPLQAPFSDDAGLPSYSITLVRGKQLTRYLGMVCTALTLKFTQGGLLTFDSTWLGQDTETATAPTVTLPSDAPFQLTAAITRGGTAENTLQDYSLAVTNPVEAVKTINNTSLISRIAWNGSRTIVLTGTADFKDKTLYDAFKAFTSAAWVITHAQGSNDKLVLTLPAGLISDAGAAMGGEGRITLSFTLEGIYDASSATALTAELTNGQATY